MEPVTIAGGDGVIEFYRWLKRSTETLKRERGFQPTKGAKFNEATHGHLLTHLYESSAPPKSITLFKMVHILEMLDISVNPSEALAYLQKNMSATAKNAETDKLKYHFEEAGAELDKYVGPSTRAQEPDAHSFRRKFQ